MILKPNRVLMSNSQVFNVINSQATTKLDLSFMDKANHVNLADIDADLTLIEKTNAPLAGAVVRAVKMGKIILGHTDSMKSSIVFMYGMDKTKTSIENVFVNITRYSKIEKTVDFRTGEQVNKYTIIGGHEVLYNILLSAYIGMNAQRVYNSPSVVNKIRSIYADVFSRITSYRFGNPGDGEKLRFLVTWFFYNGEVSARDLAMSMNFRPGEVAAMITKYPILNQNSEIGLSEFLALLGQEFPSLTKKGIEKPINFILETVSSIGDNAVYMLDNQPYFLSVIVSRARKSKIFPGYMLKDIESDAGSLMSAILQAVV